MFVRLLVALLLAMNAAVLGWWWLRTPEAAPAAAAPADVPTLMLLSETESRSMPAVEAVAPIEPLSEQPRCFTLGPFASPADSRRAMAALQPVVEQMQFRESSSAQLRGYRVFLPAFADRAAALAMARDLAARGVGDYYVVTSGEAQNTISLGLFRDLGNAEKRRDELRALGVEARLEPRSEEVAQWWLDLRVDESVGWRERLDAGTAARAEEVDCR